MKTLALDDAQRDLRALVRDLAASGPIILTDGGLPIAQIDAVLPLNLNSSTVKERSLLDLIPWESGGSLRPYPHPDDDILGEMLEGKSYDGTPHAYKPEDDRW